MANDKMEINLKYVDSCRHCKGTGIVDGKPCCVCLGKKKVMVQKRIEITITPLL